MHSKKLYTHAITLILETLILHLRNTHLFIVILVK